MNITTQKLILELNTHNNHEYELNLIKAVTGLNVKHVLGCYKGIKNNAYIVEIHNNTQFKLVMSLAHSFKQESVLYIDSNGFASLEYMNGSNTPLGLFKLVLDPSSLDAYTIDPITGLAYAA